jgi:uncharacterized protein
MKCPRCANTLSAEKYEGIEVKKCQGCQGLWVPGYSLTRIIEIREESFSIEEIAAYRDLHEAHNGLVHDASEKIRCPECDIELSQHHYNYAAEVLIDRCPQGHGVWLDRGEIEHIQMAVEEEEGELQAVVAEKQLKVEKFELLKGEEDKYRFSFWRFFLWRG